MSEYTPKNMPEVTILFDFTPGEATTWHNPGWPDKVYITDVQIYGEPVSVDLFKGLMEQFETGWKNEIIENKPERRRAV